MVLSVNPDVIENGRIERGRSDIVDWGIHSTIQDNICDCNSVWVEKSDSEEETNWHDCLNR